MPSVSICGPKPHEQYQFVLALARNTPGCQYVSRLGRALTPPRGVLTLCHAYWLVTLWRVAAFRKTLANLPSPHLKLLVLRRIAAAIEKGILKS